MLSFVSQDGDITNFNADLKEFFGESARLTALWQTRRLTDGPADFIQQNYGVASSQFVQAIQTGTEPFVGSASLLINNFNVALNH